MNRRQFFGMSAAAVALAGLPALVLPERSIFLPPRFGWQPYKLGDGYMREVEQYVINTDSLAYRYDAVGADLWGREVQFHVDTLKMRPEIARAIIEARFAQDGLRALRPGEGRHLHLKLPQTALARYV